VSLPSSSEAVPEPLPEEPAAGTGTDPSSERHLVPAPTVPAVVVENVQVRFKTVGESRPTLKSSLRSLKSSRTKRTVDALKGVSFEVAMGSVYGVIGRNGAGKSTLFRTIAGILPPTKGRVMVAGRVTPLLSLGLGFNRELSGRENVLLGGLSAGLHVEEILENYHAIVRFAELGAAIDSPMRTYSSGMFARLGFAVAVHLEPEILLIDEALSAGDARFARRSRNKIEELAAGNCTFMLVSHGLNIVSDLADRCVWLDQGLVRAEGPTDEVIEGYLAEDELINAAEAMEDF